MERPATYELFISHAKADQQWVYGYLLPELGLSPKQVITPSQFQLGKPIVAEFERTIKTSRYVILVFTPAYITDDWADFSEQLATYAAVAGQRDRLIPIKLEEVSIPLRIEFRVSLDFRLPDDWAAETTRLRNLLQIPEPSTEEIPCPYPGLRPFTTENASVFFGRDDEIGEMLRRLRHQHFIAIIGASGSGKSSLIYAGILSQLPQSGFFAKDYWLIRDMRPGDQPTQRLSALLEGDLTTDPGTLICDLLDKNKPSERLLLIIDQFEELFNLASRDEQDKFTTALQNLRRHPDCCILLCMRAAFYQDLMGSRLWPIDASERLELVPLRDEALAKAIEKPASGVGVFLEPKLLDRLLSDAANEPGVLPLMQEAMVLLWEKRSNKLITFQSYRQLGKSGLAVAMAAKADATYESLLPEQQLIARRIFLRLVQFGEGRPDTRRQQPVSELHSTDDNSTEFTTCINHLVNNRLLTFNAEENSKDPNVDIAHESLIDGWPKLQGWIRERRETEQVRRRLEQKADEWVRLGRRHGGLLDATELLEATSWLNSPDAKDLGFSADVQALVKVSQDELNAIAQAKEVARQKEIKDIRQRNYIISTIAAIAIGAFFYALIELNTAQSRQLAAQALTYINTELDRALEVSVEAFEKQDNLDTKGSLLASLAYSPNISTFLHGHSSLAWKVKMSPTNGKLFVSGHSDGSIMFWDLSNKTLTQKQPSAKHLKRVNDIAFSPDGTLIASCDPTGKIILWSASTHDSIGAFTSKNINILALAFNRNGSVLASGGSDSRITLWDVRRRLLLDTLQVEHTESINCLAFNPSDTVLASGSSDDNILLWKKSGRTYVAKEEPLEGHGGDVKAIAFNRDGTLLISGSSGDVDQNLIVWDIANHKAIGYPLLGHTDTVTGIVFSPNSDTLYTCSADKIIRRWNTNTYVANGWTLVGHRDQVNAIDITPNGKTLVSSGIDNKIILWDASTASLLGQKLQEHPFAIQYVGFSSDKKKVLSVDTHGTISFGESSEKLPFKQVQYNYELGTPNRLALSPDRTILASGNTDGTVTLWDLVARRPRCQPIKLHSSEISGICFYKDGNLIATGSTDGTVNLWDINKKSRIGAPLKVYRGEVNDVAFSPDGLTLAACYDRSSIALWDVQQLIHSEKTAPHKIIYLDNFVNTIAFDPQGNRMVAGNVSGDCDSYNIFLWNKLTTSQPVPFGGSEDQIQQLAFSPDGNRIVSGDYDGRVKVWGVSEKKRLQSLIHVDKTITDLAYSPSGKLLAVSSEDSIIQIYNSTSDRAIYSLKGHQKIVKSVVFINEDVLASASSDNKIILWDLKSQNHTMLKRANRLIKSVAFSSDGETVALGDEDGKVIIWNAVRQRTIASFIAHQQSINSLDFSSDGQLLASGSTDSTVKVWDIRFPKKPLKVLKGHADQINCVKFKPDVNILASASDDATIRLWALNDQNNVVSILRGHSRPINQIAFSPDGNYLASAGNDRKIVLWNVNKKERLSPDFAGGHTNSIFDLAFSPDGKMLVSGGADWRINLWNVSDRIRIGSSFSSPGEVWTTTFSPDGKYILTGGSYHTVIRWDLDPKKWAEKAKQIANIKEN